MTKREIITYLRNTYPKSDFEKGKYDLLKKYLNCLDSMNRVQALKYCANTINNINEEYNRGYTTMYLSL